MGGQACVFYGAAEFSRDCDIVIFAEDTNFERLQNALVDLQATCIAVPPFERKYLDRGHAVHFRCKHPDALDMRLDVMTKMRCVDDFEFLWERRTTIEDQEKIRYEVLGVQDLVKAKKTQRDKDWPMIRRLIESHYASNQIAPTEDRIRFWLLESRTPVMLMDLAANYSETAHSLIEKRLLLSDALNANERGVKQQLNDEQNIEKEVDENYWAPLKKELELIRMQIRTKLHDEKNI